ncbi:AGAP011638-PA-like protein [Anopheles sinensis]|uniref:AGAP011638-PA-like protein n=1 Tax=Anopheles sinensis TaxID=74873 RepID=A0A084VI99_ANOSI|nr:AGAP011638-PA-like protein [Anopheles sinensis]
MKKLKKENLLRHLDSSNLSSHHQLNQHRSSSVGPRPPTSSSAVEIRPASMSTTMNYSNNAVPSPNTTSMILQARASMNSAEIAKEKAVAMQVQRQLFPKPVLSNQQQILNNLAMSAGLTSLTSGAGNTKILETSEAGNTGNF